MDDDNSFLAGLERATLRNEGFRHTDHLRAAYLYISREGYPLGAHRIGEVIRNFATAHGSVDKYHVTLTLVWARLVACHIAAGSTAGFAEFLAANGELRDKSLPLRHYSCARLFSPLARQQWCDPDLEPLPAVRPWSTHGER